jgi:hypothetical protein
MEQQTITLILGLAGIFATLISASLGFFFTAKARSAPLRELLYVKQIELIYKIMPELKKIIVYFAILSGTDETVKEKTEKTLLEHCSIFSDLVDEGEVVLPTKLCIMCSMVNSEVTRMLSEYEVKREIVKNKIGRLTATSLQLIINARSMFGVDPLSEESLSLFSSSKDIEEIEKISTLLNKS